MKLLIALLTKEEDIAIAKLNDSLRERLENLKMELNKIRLQRSENKFPSEEFAAVLCHIKYVFMSHRSCANKN